MGMSDEGSGASVTLSAGGNETADTTIGIDVSKYQGTIDWAEVASSGVDFAMIRVGYRTQKTGVIYADTNAKYNMQQAAANGIKVGVYFFSSAVNESCQASETFSFFAQQHSSEVTMADTNLTVVSYRTRDTECLQTDTDSLPPK